MGLLARFLGRLATSTSQAASPTQSIAASGSSKGAVRPSVAGLRPTATNASRIDSRARENALALLGSQGIVQGSRASNGDSHLVAAAARNDLPQVRLLLAAGWNPSERGSSSNSNTALHEAACGGYAAIADALIAAGASLDIANSRGIRPLHFAAGYGLRDVVEMLLAAGADVNATDEAGRTPLHEAASRASRDVLELLITCKANAELKTLPDYGGSAALHLAVNEDPAAVQSLLAAGVAVDPVDAELRTPLHLAATCGYRDTAAVLLDNGAVVSKRDVDGNTALHLAVKEEKSSVVALLLSRKADARARNKQGESPLFMLTALNLNAAAVAGLVLKHGAAPMDTDLEGRTAQDRLAEKDRQWSDYFRTGVLAAPPGTPDGASDYVLNACLEVQSLGSDERRARGLVERGEKAQTPTDAQALGRLALSGLPSVDACIAELSNAAIGATAFRRALVAVRALLLSDRPPFHAARAVLSAWENRASEVGLADFCDNDVIYDEMRLMARLLRQDAGDRLVAALDEIDDVPRAMEFLSDHLSGSMIEVEAAWVRLLRDLSYKKHLLLVFLKTRQEALDLVRASLERMRQDKGFRRFAANLSLPYRCLHIRSSHDDDGRSYRKHVFIWTVREGYAVGKSDDLTVFGQYSPPI